MLALLLSRRRGPVEQVVSSDDVVDHRTLADFLAPELMLSAKVAPVVVPEVVVRGNAEELDAGVDEELGEDRLELRLSAPEVVTTNERLVPLRERDAPGHERVLRRAVDERHALEDRRDHEERRGRHLVVQCLDRAQEVVCGVTHAREDVGEALRVGRPEDDQPVVGLELADVGAELLEVGLLVIAEKKVICTLLLIGGDEVGVVDRGERLDRSHQENRTWARCIAASRGAPEMSHPPMTRPLGCEDGGEGDMDVLARDGSTLRRRVEAWRTEPM